MKKFLKFLLLFLLPVILIGISAEILLRRIPNNYILKNEFLEKNSDSLQILFLGSSHAYYDINPALISAKSFNAASMSQSLDYDWAILSKYKDRLKSLRCIVIPISAFTLYSNLKNGQEAFRVKNYVLYYNIHEAAHFSNYAEVFSNNLTNIQRLYKYYILDIDNINSSKLGWGFDYSYSKKRDLLETGILAADRHKKKDNKYFAENKKLLMAFIEFAKERKIELFFYTPPAYYTYTDRINKDQLSETFETIQKITRENKDAVYYNFFKDSNFTASDFFDADHLNEIGAKKLTVKIDTLIRNNYQENN